MQDNKEVHVIKIHQLKKTYNKTPVLNGIDFDIRPGEVFALLGGNGAGKTTTIKILLGLTPADGGTVELPEGLTVGYSPETPYFPPFMSGFEIMKYYAQLQGLSKKEAERVAGELLEEMGLENTKTKVSHYSKGMLQRLALAQALIGDPELLVLDEPTAGLDALGRIEILELVRRYSQRGKTILINSHILNDMERVCDRGVIIRKGVVIRRWDKKQDCERSLEDVFIASMEEKIVC
jgi:ABC-2 type transport system ATP-binding protein